MKILTLKQIKDILTSLDIFPAIGKGFVAYSSQNAVVPPVGELIFDNPPGDVHIKYGYLKDDKYYVVKIASGFYENYKLNLPSINGLLLIFDQKTGAILSILLDEGYLTNVRTAVAGAIAAKYFAPSKVTKIGIVGAGLQAKFQLMYLKKIIDCNEVIVWARSKERLDQFQKKMANSGYAIQLTQNIEELTSVCNLIVTTTPSTKPLLKAMDIRPGTHITAVGADTPHKQELEASVFKKADLIVADSIAQCVVRGDIAHAIKEKMINETQLIELGNVIAGRSPKRTSDKQISIVDLTGLAVQDIQISKAVYESS